MKLVLMSCCAPCSAGAIKQLADGQIPGVDDFIVLFFNPNIFPAAEYDKRLAEQIRYCEKLGVKYAIGEYDHAAWRDAVRGMEDAPERGVRCSACFKFRFEYARRWAAEHGYDAVSSVFGVSRHKDQSQVDRAGYDVFPHPPSSQAMTPPAPNAWGGGHSDATQNVTRRGVENIQYIPINWDEALRCEINRASDFYRQKYCGCEFSMRRDTNATQNTEKIMVVR